jgi:hypothetical protein
MSGQTEAGTCSACGAAAEHGQSGAWWHTGEPCGRCPATFQPARQQQTPRDRQTKTPGRDR